MESIDLLDLQFPPLVPVERSKQLDASPRVHTSTPYPVETIIESELKRSRTLQQSRLSGDCRSIEADRTAIRVDHSDSALSGPGPIVYLIASDGYRAEVLAVDVIKTLSSSPELLDHPVMVYAVRHLQSLVAGRKYSKETNKKADTASRKLNHRYIGRVVDKAKRDLKQISKSLLREANDLTIGKETALRMKMDELGAKRTTTLLWAAWEDLPYFDKKQGIRGIEGKLRETSKGPAAPESVEGDFGRTPNNVDHIVEFLKNQGAKYALDVSTIHSTKPNWQTFVRAFEAFHFRMEKSTIEYYRKTSKQEPSRGESEIRQLFGIAETHWLEMPLREVEDSRFVTVGPPVLCTAELALNPLFQLHLGGFVFAHRGT